MPDPRVSVCYILSMTRTGTFGDMQNLLWSRCCPWRVANHCTAVSFKIRHFFTVRDKNVQLRIVVSISRSRSPSRLMRPRDQISAFLLETWAQRESYRYRLRRLNTNYNNLLKGY
ncbi:hypothetical protein RRG08_021222 [Elysia crispata]|uniref:Uncharacterized protein n=1 Tax=Elysia crispata TaxID=231223 RepID=A0AAE0YXV1_9GAST|nr:hypothetical protein RRG08_021222 [Elysia crispata]